MSESLPATSAKFGTLVPPAWHQPAEVLHEPKQGAVSFRCTEAEVGRYRAHFRPWMFALTIGSTCIPPCLVGLPSVDVLLGLAGLGAAVGVVVHWLHASAVRRFLRRADVALSWSATTLTMTIGGLKPTEIPWASLRGATLSNGVWLLRFRWNDVVVPIPARILQSSTASDLAENLQQALRGFQQKWERP